MSKFIPEKLFVEYKGDNKSNIPKEKRKYTLTHSDETGDLFLTIGEEYDYEKTNDTRDEVLAEWNKKDEIDILNVVLQVTVDSNIAKTIIRDKIFREELPLALEAIMYGDRQFLKEDSNLYNAPIIINFQSEILKYNKVEQWGTVSDYLNENTRLEEVKNLYKRDYDKDILEETIIRLLALYIKIEVNILFGREAVYCLREAEILKSQKIEAEEYLPDEIEVSIGLKVGSITPIYNNAIITFLIKDNVVKIKDSKMINI